MGANIALTGILVLSIVLLMSAVLSERKFVAIAIGLGLIISFPLMFIGGLIYIWG